MRWRSRPEDGEHRVFKTFLWLPKEVSTETRWFETAYILQKYRRGDARYEVPDEWYSLLYVDEHYIIGDELSYKREKINSCLKANENSPESLYDKYALDFLTMINENNDLTPKQSDFLDKLYKKACAYNF